MSIPRDVSIPGCQYPGMSKKRRCQYPGMPIPRDVSIPGCQYPGMSVPWDVSTLGCHYLKYIRQILVSIYGYGCRGSNATFSGFAIESPFHSAVPRWMFGWLDDWRAIVIGRIGSIRNNSDMWYASPSKNLLLSCWSFYILFLKIIENRWECSWEGCWAS